MLNAPVGNNELSSRAHGTTRRLFVDWLSQSLGADLCREKPVGTGGGHGNFPKIYIGFTKIVLYARRKTRARLLVTEAFALRRFIFMVPFKQNGIWSWWVVTVFLSIISPTEFHWVRNPLFLSMWRESEIYISECALSWGKCCLIWLPIGYM